MSKALVPRKKPSGIRTQLTKGGKKKSNPLPPITFSPPGQPTLYKTEYDEVVYRFAILGYEDDELAQFLGISRDTLYEWMKRHQTFSDSRARGKEKSNSEVEAALRERALGYTHKTEKVFLGPGGQIVTHVSDQHYPPDAKSVELWLNNRSPARWKDRRVVENTGEVGIKVVVTGGLPKETGDDE